MVISSEATKVYFSRKLLSEDDFKVTLNSLTQILSKHKVSYSFLKATKDIWCRDYMPIQIDKGKFVQFRYEPSYLQAELEYQSNPQEICEANNIKAKYSQINLDGGNLVNWSDRAIISDRVFDENPEYSSKIKLISEIEKLLEVEIIVIPQIKCDMTGHADGMIRFVDRNTVLGNDREKEYKYWSKSVNKVLKENGIDYIDIPFLNHKERKYPNHAIGCYVNYLEVHNLIVLPIFEIENNKDQEVYEKFKYIFPNKKIETLNFNKIGLHGGLLNCTTWTIKD